MPTLYIVGGPNGAGKTTTALKLFPQLGVTQFVNADLIAQGISPLNVEAQARTAARIMLEIMEELSNSDRDFALETTLASRSLYSFATECQSKGFQFHLIYIWLASPELAVQRVAKRVRSGGHNIPENVIRRRYERGRANFYNLYRPIADTWTVLDNSGEQTKLVAEGEKELMTQVFFPDIWQTIIEGEIV